MPAATATRTRRPHGRYPDHDTAKVPPRDFSADFQPPYTAGHHATKVMLDGEPVPAAVKASTRAGWVQVAATDEDGFPRRLTGTVTLVPVPLMSR